MIFIRKIKLVFAPNGPVSKDLLLSQTGEHQLYPNREKPNLSAAYRLFTWYS